MRPLFIFTVIGFMCSNVVFGIPDSTQTKSKASGNKKITETKKPATDEKVKKKEAIKPAADKKAKVSKKPVVEKKPDPTKQVEPKAKKEAQEKQVKETKPKGTKEVVQPRKEVATETKKAEKDTVQPEKKEVKPATPAKKVKPAPKAERKAKPKKKKVVTKDTPPPPHSYEIILYRADMCTCIDKHVPEGSGNKFKKDVKRLYCFSHITGAKDTLSIFHKWFHNDKEVGFSVLAIKSKYFRTYSYRDIEPTQTGSWRVDIINSKSGEVLKTLNFKIE